METKTKEKSEVRARSPWEILGVSEGASEEEIRKAFRSKARQLHPDKGGSASEFRELYDAYNVLRDTTNLKEDEDDEWLGWLSRWAKRFIGTDNKILRIKIPYKMLEDRSQTINMEYDGIPVTMNLEETEKISFGGLRIRLIPHAFIIRKTGESEIESEWKEEPWFKDTEWLFMVPNDTIKFRIKGGEWSENRGEYCKGVYWQ